MADPEHARAEVCLRGAMLEEQAGIAPQTGRVERGSHHQEHVDILWVQLVGDEGSKYHEPRQVTGCLSDAVDAREAEGHAPFAELIRRRTAREPRAVMRHAPRGLARHL